MNATITTTANPLECQPGKRVNFSAGMVLRATDFIQSQDYPLDKLNQHNLIEHGYGIVRGLAVSASRDGDDLKIVVAQGLGIDRRGRVFSVCTELCASLRAWLEKKGNPPANAKDAVVYVVASYDERLTDKVAIAEPPCSSSDSALAYSRITDSLKLELTTSKPAMPFWETTVALRELMKRVVIVYENQDGNRNDEDDVTALNTAIHGLATSLTLPATPALFRINASHAQAVLSNAERIWVMETLPKVYARDVADADAPAILLATITYDATSPPVPSRLDNARVSIADSPYLLQTQVFQGLPIARQPSASTQTPQHLINFVTVTPQPPQGGKQDVELWFHLDTRVAGSQVTFGTKPPGLKVLAELADGALKEVAATALTGEPKNNIYTVALTLDAKVPAGYLRFVFDLSQATINDPQAPTSTSGKKGRANIEMPVMTYLASTGLAFEGYVPGEDDVPGSVIVFVRNMALTAVVPTSVGKKA